MVFPHRKLLEEICVLSCHVKDFSSCSSSDCLACYKHCYSEYPFYYPPPSPSIVIDYDDRDNPSKSHKISTVLTVVIALLAAAFFALICFAVYRRFLSRCVRRRRSSDTEEDTRGDFLDEEQGPVVDHPIWYIRTPGLQQSIISAITVCKYKKGEGLIDGTECSVCLSEFEEDENLRLLPKCNHAFHLPCIDTWLRSHTNCPMCRAPIVTNPATVIASPESNGVTSTDSEEPQMEIVENGRENSGVVVENTDGELRSGDEEEGGGRRREVVAEEEVENWQPRRRSVSLDSSSVEKINRALARTTNVMSSVESSSSSKRVSKSSSSSFRIKSLQIVAGTSMKRSRSYHGKHPHSSNNRSQRKPNALVRSF